MKRVIYHQDYSLSFGLEFDMKVKNEGVLRLTVLDVSNPEEIIFTDGDGTWFLGQQEIEEIIEYIHDWGNEVITKHGRWYQEADGETYFV